MKLPVKVLQGLAAAVVLVGMAGCDCGKSPTGETPRSTDPNVTGDGTPRSSDPNVAPQQQRPGEVCEPGGGAAPCPACGRG
jgi:hypothetical protein